jgi:hypothetical protein
MGKRHGRRTPEVISFQPFDCKVAADCESRVKRRRAGDDEDSDSTDSVARTLVFMRLNKFPQVSTLENIKKTEPDVSHVTDDENEEDDSHPPRILPSLVSRVRLASLPPVTMALPRPPQLHRPPKLVMPKNLQSSLQQRLRAPCLPEGRPLPPAPVLPSAETWTALLAGHQAKD